MEKDSSAGTVRPRPGAVRRWLVRPLAWLLAALALLVAVATLVARSDAARRWVQETLEERLSDALGRPVTAGGVRLELLPPALEVEELTIPGPAATDPPVAEVPFLRLEVGLWELLEREVVLERIRVERPVLRLLVDAEGGTNLPELRREGDGGTTVRVGVVELDRAQVLINDSRRELSFTARGFELEAAGRGPALDLAGRLAIDELDLALPGAAPYAVAVESRFGLDESGLELRQGAVSGEDLKADFEGELRFTPEPALDLRTRIDARAELAERLGYLAGVAGAVQAELRLAGPLAAWELRGTAGSPRLRLADRELTAVDTELVADASALALSIARAGHAGGTVAGRVLVGLAEPDRPVQADLELAGLQVARLIADQGLPIDSLGGQISGTVAYRFDASGPENGSGWARLRVLPREKERGVLSLAGDLLLNLEAGQLRCETGRLRSARQQLFIEWLAIDLATWTGQGEFRLETRDLLGLARLLPGDLVASAAAAGAEPAEPLPLWVPETGVGTIHGRVEIGGSEGPRAALRLDLNGLEKQGFLADRLRGSLAASAAGVDDLRLELTRNQGAMLVTGGVGFGGEDEAGTLDLAIDLAAWPSAELWGLLGRELPLDGPVSGVLTLDGTPEAPTGRLDAALAPALVSSLEFERLAARLAFSPERAAIDELRLTAEAGEVLARGTVSFAAPAGDAADEVGGAVLDLEVEARGLALDRAPLAALGAGDLTGQVSVLGSIRGPIDAPLAALTVASQDLALAGRRFGSAELAVGLTSEELTVNGGVPGLLSLAGGGRVAEQGVDVELALEAPDLAALVAVAGGARIEGLGGAAAGRLLVSGDPAALAWRLELPRAALRYESLRYASLEPIVVVVEGGVLRIQSLYLGDEASDDELFFFGDLDFETGALDMRLQATVAAALVETVVPQARVRGTVNALGRIAGTLERPIFDGQSDLVDGQLILAGFPHSLDNLRATLLVYPDRAVLDHLSARLGGGRVEGAGEARLAGETAGDFQLRAKGTGVRLRYPAGWATGGDFELVLTQREKERVLAGSVELDRAYYLEDLPANVFQFLTGLLRRQRLEAGIADERLTATQLNLSVVAPGTLRVSNNIADLRGKADLAVRGTLARPVVIGEVELDEGGELTYSGSEYKVQRGLLTFASLDRIQPVVDLVAKNRVRDYDVTLTLSGTIERLNATFSSDPPLSDLTVLSLLATGEPLDLESGSAPAGSPAGGGAESFIFGQAASAISRRVETLFGFDKVRIDPTATAGSEVDSARITVGKQISRDLYVTYSRDPSSNRSQVVQAEWQIESNLVLVLTFVDSGQYAVDARWDVRF